MPYVNNNGVRIFYKTVGQGPPLLLLHPALCDRTFWRDAGYLDGLKEYRCVLMDCRGHGLSDHPHGIDAHRIYNHVSDVIAVLDDLKISRCPIWGFSLGGYLACAVAANHPDRVMAVIVQGSFYKWMPPEQVKAEAEAMRSQGLQARVEKLSQAMEYPPWAKKALLAGDPEVFVSEILAWAEGDSKMVPRSDIPVLFLWGSKEGWSPAAELNAKQLGRVVKFEGLDHAQLGVRTDLILPVAREFLASNQWGKVNNPSLA